METKIMYFKIQENSNNELKNKKIDLIGKINEQILQLSLKK